MKRILKITFLLLVCLTSLVAMCSCFLVHEHYVAYIDQAEVEPTCLQIGGFYEIEYCECGHEMSRTTIEVIPATGLHDYTYDSDSGSLRCKNCKTKLECSHYNSEELSYQLSEDGTYVIIKGHYITENESTEISPYAITIPAEIGYKPVKKISSSAFCELKNLVYIKIPSSVTSIGDSAFQECYSLTSVTIPDGVTSIGDRAFYNCSTLTDVYITDIAKWCEIDFGYYSNPLYYGANLYLNGELVTDLVIPDGVTSIPYMAFSGCSLLKSVSFAEGSQLTYIGSNAFQNCSRLTSIIIPDSVTHIGNDILSDTAFYSNPENWESGVLYSGNHLIDASNDIWGALEIKAGTITIAPRAFSECKRITKLTIPTSVTYIGGYAFADCTSLKDVYYAGSEEEWAAITNNSTDDLNATIHYNYTE